MKFCLIYCKNYTLFDIHFMSYHARMHGCAHVQKMYVKIDFKSFAILNYFNFNLLICESELSGITTTQY